MPELPDVTVYVEALTRRVVGRTLQAVRLNSPFVLRTVDPPPAAAVGRRIVGVRRVGKRIVLETEASEAGAIFLVIHLMIAGRLQWKKPGARFAGKLDLVAFDFEDGSLVFTEAGSKKRASLHVVGGEAALSALDPGGVEPLDVDVAAFAAALRRENRTLKRALTDPRTVSGVGNAYSDEVLHRAKLSPFLRTADADDATLARLHAATREVLLEWTGRLRAETGDGFPKKVTAFRPEMAVHGKFGEPCPVCGTSVQRIVKGESESNYCPRCQTGGRMLADRALSQLLKDDWPSTVDEWEADAGFKGTVDRRPGRR